MDKKKRTKILGGIVAVLLLGIAVSYYSSKSSATTPDRTAYCHLQRQILSDCF